MHRHVLAPIETAVAIIGEERSEVRAERDAFADLVERVAACPARSPAGDACAVETGVHDRVRRAYRETVLCLDHHHSESLDDDIAIELGADLATALRAGTPFTPAFKAALTDAARDARAEREWFLDVLRREERSLAESKTELADIVDAMRSRHGDATSELRRRCERVGDDRQQVVQDQLRSARGTDALYDYLYRDQSWTHPVLTVVATLVEDLDGRCRDPSTDRVA